MKFSRNFTFVIFIIFCCFEEKSASLTSPDFISSTSEPLNISTITTSVDNSSSTVSEQTKTTNVHESSDLRSSSASSITQIAASSVENKTSTSSASVPHSVPSSSSACTHSCDQFPPSSEHFDSDKCSKSGVPFRPIAIRCPAGSLDEFATDSRICYEGSSLCIEAKDCLNVGWARNKSLRLDVTCVYHSGLRDSGCCYKETKGLCSQGMSALPIQNCKTKDDCNLYKNRTTQRWCDPVSKTCCRFENEHVLFCPDKTISPMNEPLCEDINPDDIYSGTCPMKNGMCKHGHCCPSNKTETIFPGKPYRTNEECTGNTVIPETLVHGFCDPNTRKIHVMSEMNEFGQKNKALESYCLRGRDCGRSYGVDNVCVRLSSDHLRCYINPNINYYVPRKRSTFWFTVFCYSSLGASLLAIVFSFLYKIYSIDDSSDSTYSEISKPLISSAEQCVE